VRNKKEALREKLLELLELLDLLEHASLNAADRALFWSRLLHGHAAYRADKVGIAILLGIQALQHIVIKLSMVLLYCIGVG